MRFSTCKYLAAASSLSAIVFALNVGTLEAFTTNPRMAPTSTMMTPSSNRRWTSASPPLLGLSSTSSTSSSSSSNESDNETTQQQQQQQPQVVADEQLVLSSSKHNSFLGRVPSSVVASTAAAAAMMAVVMAANPGVSNALDLASLSGGAGSLATSTNNWLTSIGETGFYQAFTLVFLSEIGDKTFFIAGLLAMKTSRLISFIGSVSALAVMTVISVVIGQVFHAVPSGLADGIPLDDVAAVLAFAFFGFKTLKEALDMDEGDSIMDEELRDAEEEVEANDASKQATIAARIFSIFGLVFAAEFGDRSFLSTIALSAAQNPVSVAVGATAAHAVATGIAVTGGAVVAKYLSEKVIGIIGGTLFLVFAATTAFGIF